MKDKNEKCPIFYEKKILMSQSLCLGCGDCGVLTIDSIRLTDVHLTSSFHYPFNLPQSGLRCVPHRSQYFGDKSPSPHPLPHSEITITLITFHEPYIKWESGDSCQKWTNYWLISSLRLFLSLSVTKNNYNIFTKAFCTSYFSYFRLLEYSAPKHFSLHFV